MYVYDAHDRTKGSGAVLGMAGLFATGTFTFLIAFSYLSRGRQRMSAQTPMFMLLASLSVPAALTISLWNDVRDYLGLILGGWIAILVSGLGALAVSKRLRQPPKR